MNRKEAEDLLRKIDPNGTMDERVLDDNPSIRAALQQPMKKIAIVGADEEKWKKAGILLGYVNTIIFELCIDLYNKHGQFIMVSGGCPKGGVDIIAESVADELIGGFLGGNNPMIYQKAIFYPDEKKWSCRGFKWGYKERNLIIAAYSDIVYCIDPKGVKSGGNWTLIQARKLGKEVHRIEL